MRRGPTGFYTIRQLSEMTGISAKTLYKLANDNHIPSVKLGRRLLVPIDKWEQFVEKQTNQAGKARTCRGRPPLFDLGEDPILAQLHLE